MAATPRFRRIALTDHRTRCLCVDCVKERSHAGTFAQRHFDKRTVTSMKSSLSSMIHRLTSERGKADQAHPLDDASPEAFDGGYEADERALDEAEPREPEETARQVPPRVMDAAGQQSETTRASIAQIANRLEELDTLRLDFNRLIQPVVSLIDEFPSLQAKLLDANSLLDDERKYSRQLRHELSDLSVTSGRTEDEFAGARSQLKKYEASIDGLEALLSEVRLEFRDRDLVASELEKQLLAESEQARSLADENQSMRQEAQATDQSLTRLERDLLEARGQIELLEHDNKMLRAATDEQLERHSALSSRHAELAHRFDTVRQAYSEIELRASNEAALREKVEQQRETERSSFMSQISALEMKLEGLTSRLTVAEKILGNTRDQLREANDAARLADRRSKEAVIERNNFERRAAALQGDAQRQAAQIGDLEKARLELIEQTEMMKKAMAAKDAQVEQADMRSAGLTQRIEELIRRSEIERGQLEAKNRRLLEELQEERSERALARGALDAARDSRNRLQAELLALKKGQPFNGTSAAVEADDPPEVPQTPPSVSRNVMRLRAEEAESPKGASGA